MSPLMWVFAFVTWVFLATVLFVWLVTFALIGITT